MRTDGTGRALAAPDRERRRLADEIDARARERLRDPDVVEGGPWALVLGEIERSADRVYSIDERAAYEWRREMAYEREVRDYADEVSAATGEPVDVRMCERERREAAKHVRAWLEESRKERSHLSDAAGAAIRAGLSEVYLRSAREDGGRMAEVLRDALDAAEVTGDARRAAMGVLRDGVRESLAGGHGDTPRHTDSPKGRELGTIDADT